MTPSELKDLLAQPSDVGDGKEEEQKEGDLCVFDCGPPQESPRLRVYDHHGKYYNPDLPEVNSTEQVLRDISAFVEKHGHGEDSVEKLEKRFERVHTDNLGDGLWCVWISRNIQRVATDSNLRALISRCTNYEDFGLFGQSVLKASLHDAELKIAIILQEAIFNGYDRLIARYYVTNLEISKHFHNSIFNSATFSLLGIIFPRTVSVTYQTKINTSWWRVV